MARTMTIDEKAFRHVLDRDDVKAVRQLRLLEVSDLSDLLERIDHFRGLVLIARRQLRDERQTEAVSQTSPFDSHEPAE